MLAPTTEIAVNRDDLASVASGRTMTGDRTVARRDGALIRVMTFTRPVFDASGQVVALVGRPRTSPRSA